MRILPLVAVLIATTLAEAHPAACPPNGNLDYYRCRAADFVVRNPGHALPDYYLEYGDVYVRRLTAETQPLLSPVGQAWMDRARVNLQIAMEARREADPQAFAELERDASAFRAFGFETHTAAYRDAGVDQLPLRDLILIGITPDMQDLLGKDGLRQLLSIAHVLGDSCRQEGLRPCARERRLREKRELIRRFRNFWGLQPASSVSRFILRRMRDSLLRVFANAPREATKRGATGALSSAPTR